MEYTLTAAMAVMAGSNLGAIGVAAVRWYHSRACTPDHPCAACRGAVNPVQADLALGDREVPILTVSEMPHYTSEIDPVVTKRRAEIHLVR